jgi:predicted kinase
MENKFPINIPDMVTEYAHKEPIVLFYGLAGCKKTTMASTIADIFEGRYVTPAKFGIAHLEGGTPLPHLRLRRYSKFFKELELTIQKGGTIVADGCFDLPSVKKRLLKMASMYDSRKWIFVRCITSNREQTIQRLIKRGQENPTSDPRACTEESLKVTEAGLTDDFLDFCIHRNESGEGYLHGILDSMNSRVHWDGPEENMVYAKEAINFLVLYGETRYCWRMKNE